MEEVAVQQVEAIKRKRGPKPGYTLRDEDRQRIREQRTKDKTNPPEEKAWIRWGEEWLAARVIRNMASKGFSEKKIAQVFGVAKKTFQDAMHNWPHIQKALLDGRSNADKAIVAKIFETAMGGQEVVTISEDRAASGKLYRRNIIRAELPPNPKLLLSWVANHDPEHWGRSLESGATNNTIVINQQTITEDLERLKRLAGSLIEQPKQIESTVVENTDSKESVQPDTDKSSG